MLTPASPLTPYLLALLFLALLGFMVFSAVRKDRREYRRFKRMRSTKRRQKVLRKWVRESFVNFGGAAVVVLLLSWQFVAPFRDSVEDWDFVRAGRQAFDDSGWLGPTLGIALVAAIGVGMLLGIVLARNETEVMSIGDVAALLPRNRAELKYGAALAINAGVVEELLFRLALPALIFGVTGNSIAAVVASIVIFGGLHVYQGLPGIVGATILGAIFMAIYLATGSIVVAIVVHALFDLRSLVVIPVVVFGVHKELGNGAPVVKKKTESDVDVAGATKA
ncbi:membrane protease YdiL (CAAX protease family) [Conyzicola lurida]|uniref:Membrane protease YdiL (CAAX protease family) n=1 Tax=Conyzicola lurida TaxID=1172621 RepID=A0A841AKM9_9MICO|nr:membrane protease YdiL (CAAX protease family) [Conyzicola lurida]